MKARTIIITAIAAVALAAPGVTFAQGFGQGGGFGGGFGAHGGFGGPGDLGARGLHRLERMLPRMADRIGLTGEQVDLIQKALDDADDDVAVHVGNLRQIAQDFGYGEGCDPGTFNEQNLRDFLDAQHDDKVEIHVITARTMHYIFYTVMSPEQREQMQGLKTMMGGRGPHRSGGQTGS